MALLAELSGEFERVIVQKREEGFYVLAYGQGANYPCRDHLQDNLGMAKLQALEDYGVVEDSWQEIPDIGDDCKA